ncbi:hypothetical protein F4809DRAFT_315960 [Biscogniauxia mediterranea]|nr:hypothetical protein F4809DRAFT_315960 [Biscogniauxia mediterranea]
MPITREPSQRALNWVRRNTSKSSLSSVKSNSPTEIIHLGGSRVGTPTEPDPPAPDRSRPVERPITTWAFTPPPPAPPGIGTARSAPEPLNEIAQTPTELYAPGHDERPITQWYPPEWQQPASATTDGGFGDQHQNQNQNYGMLAVPTGLNPAPLKMIATKPPPNAPPPTSFPSPVSSLPSAISSSSSYSSSSLSAARRRSPVTQPYIASGLSHYNTSEETGEEPNYRPQRDTPPSPLIPKDDADSISSLRRTQSQADMHTRSQWKALPPRPLGGRGSGNSNSSGDEAYINNNNNNYFSINNSSGREDYQQQQQQNGRHVGQLLRSNTSPSNHTGALRVFPPLANAPPKSSLPAITESRAGGSSSSSSRPRTSERRKERSPPPRQPSSSSGRASPPPPPPPPPPHPPQPAPPPPPQVKPPPRLTPRERLWLHRNYRGEATFLRAWGLHITSEEDREEGLAILRELMAAEEAEEEEEQEQRRRQQYHARTTTAPIPGKAEGTGLGVIVEELGSREPAGRAPPSKERLGYTAGANAQEVWRPGGATTMGPGPGSGPGGGQRLMLPIDAFHARRVDKHARSESDSSVLGAYLDIRMSRLDD